MKVPATSEKASAMKIVLISVEKISSVKRVRYFTILDAEVRDETNNIAEVQSPVHAYRGRNGILNVCASGTSVATKARTGPVEPMIVSG